MQKVNLRHILIVTLVPILFFVLISFAVNSSVSTEVKSDQPNIVIEDISDDVSLIMIK